MFFDEDGIRGLLPKGAFGYDDWENSTDRGRLFYGTGEKNFKVATLEDPHMKTIVNSQLRNQIASHHGEILFIEDIDTHAFWSKDDVWRDLGTKEVLQLSGRGTGLAGTYYEGFEDSDTIALNWTSEVFGDLVDGKIEGAWNRTKDTTTTRSTGPNGASVGEHYLYAETSGGGNNVEFTLTTSNFSYLTELSMDICLNGRDIGLFEIVTYSELAPTVRYSLAGDQGVNWIPVALNLSGMNVEKVMIRYSGASGSRGDLGIDNIRMESI